MAVQTIPQQIKAVSISRRRCNSVERHCLLKMILSKFDVQLLAQIYEEGDTRQPFNWQCPSNCEFRYTLLAFNMVNQVEKLPH